MTTPGSAPGRRVRRPTAEAPVEDVSTVRSAGRPSGRSAGWVRRTGARSGSSERSAVRSGAVAARQKDIARQSLGSDGRWKWSERGYRRGTIARWIPSARWPRAAAWLRPVRRPGSPPFSARSAGRSASWSWASVVCDDDGLPDQFRGVDRSGVGMPSPGRRSSGPVGGDQGVGGAVGRTRRRTATNAGGVLQVAGVAGAGDGLEGGGGADAGHQPPAQVGELGVAGADDHGHRDPGRPEARPAGPTTVGPWCPSR